MGGYQVNREELEKVLGLRIPETAVVEVKITERSKPKLVPTFTGRITYKEGELVSIKAVDTSAFNIDYFKLVGQQACW